jgi:hypothetical protein
MTERNQESFAFAAHFSRRVEAAFTAGQVSTDGGSLLLREAERKIKLLGRLAACFCDGRSPLLVKHPLSEMPAQRIYGLALGHEDLNDHEQLRRDPLAGGAQRQAEAGGAAGRQEHAEPAGVGRQDRPLSQGAATRPKPRTGCRRSFSSSRTPRRRPRSYSNWTPPTSRSTAIGRSAFFTATTAAAVIFRCISSPAASYSARGCGRPIKTRPPEQSAK